MWIYIGWISVVPLVFLLVYLIIKETKILLGLIELKKIKQISLIDYKKVNLPKIKVNYRIPNGQIAHFLFECKKTFKAQSQRMYTGSTTSSIPFPLSKLSLQRKRFYQKGAFIEYGPSNVTVTNKVIKINGDQAIGWTYNIKDLESIKFVENSKTILINLTKLAWPIKLQFQSYDEAKLFINACWTIFDKTKNKSIEAKENK